MALNTAKNDAQALEAQIADLHQQLALKVDAVKRLLIEVELKVDQTVLCHCPGHFRDAGGHRQPGHRSGTRAARSQRVAQPRGRCRQGCGRNEVEQCGESGGSRAQHL